MNRLILAGAALLMATACGGDDGATENGGVTAEEAVALDNAADMLDTSADSLTATDAPLGNGDAPAEPVLEANGVR